MVCQYLIADEGEDDFNLLEEQMSTVCQHVVCTQPLVESKPCPIKGLALIPHDIHTTSLLCLLSDFTCMKVAVRLVVLDVKISCKIT